MEIGHRHKTTLLAGNHHFRSEINPFHPEFQNLGLMNTSHINPGTLHHDFPLELDFARLNISNPAVYGGGGGDGGRVSSLMMMNGNNTSIDFSRGMSSFPYNQQTQTQQDLHRMRIQSAALGQAGLYNMQHQDLVQHENLDVFGMIYRDLVHGYGVNGRGRRVNGHRNGFDLLNYDQLGFEHRNIDANLQYNNKNGSVSRSKQGNFQSLEELRGRIFWAAKDQYGCRFLQRKFDERKPEEIHIIFSELKNHIGELMVDQFGNYLVQKLFEVCNEEQISQLLLLVINDERSFMTICLDMHGTRAVQKLLEHLTIPQQKSLIASVLRNITVTLTKSMNGHHVIQHCLKLFSSEDVKQILNEVAENCIDIATDKSGCCVLQHCVAHAQGEPRNRLLQEITSNALILSEHPYGNYVVQYLLSLRSTRVTANIIDQLSGKFVSLSMNKYGSNVVEKCLRESEDQALQIITEIINSPNFLMVLQDAYGNYVAQSALAISKGTIRNTMINLIHVHYAFLHSHPHGKRVLARTRGSKMRV